MLKKKKVVIVIKERASMNTNTKTSCRNVEEEKSCNRDQRASQPFVIPSPDLLATKGNPCPIKGKYPP